MFCTNCGNKIANEQMRFCTNCGKPLQNKEETPQFSSVK